MGSYQSTHTFVEPLAYGFEDDAKTEKFTVMRPVDESKTVQRDACWTCVQRTRRLIKREEAVCRQYAITILSKNRSDECQESASDELKASIEHLEYTSEKNRYATLDAERAPMHLRRQLKDAHQRRRTAILLHEHAVARAKRKVIAVANLEKLCEEAKARTQAAMNSQIKCALKHSRPV